MSSYLRVLGLGFGDEGKGLVTDYLCRTLKNEGCSTNLVVRFSGGHQAGHTVCVGDVKHVFSNFCSGTFRGATSYFFDSCVIDPIGIMNEYHILREKGAEPSLIIHPNCLICTPYDKYANEQSEEMKEHGTCGMGVYTTLTREKNGYHLQAGDVKYQSVFKNKMKLLKQWYENRNGVKLDLSLFEKAISFLNECEDIKIAIEETPHSYIIEEGSQGIMLDEMFGFFPHVTATPVVPMKKKNDDMCETMLVTRAYCTRHGNGPLPNDFECDFLIPGTETNQENKYQGKLRTCLLDMDMLRYAVDKYREYKNNNLTLVITCLDHLDPTKNESGEEIKHWKVVKEGEIVSFDTQGDFVRYIASQVGIYKLLLSRSPYSDFMKELYVENKPHLYGDGYHISNEGCCASIGRFICANNLVEK